MYVRISLPPGPGPQKSVETVEECREIKAVKHRRDKVARYLCSDNIEMVRHFGTTYGNVVRDDDNVGFPSRSIDNLYDAVVPWFHH
jgi:hypothetical protein